MKTVLLIFRIMKLEFQNAPCFIKYVAVHISYFCGHWFRSHLCYHIPLSFHTTVLILCFCLHHLPVRMITLYVLNDVHVHVQSFIGRLMWEVFAWSYCRESYHMPAVHITHHYAYVTCISVVCQQFSSPSWLHDFPINFLDWYRFSHCFCLNPCSIWTE